MMWIGLTGSIGVGKSTVADVIRKSGYPVIEADAIAHEALEKGTATYSQIVNKFGIGILNEDLTINRRTLGKKIFSDPISRQWLEACIHPLVQDRVQKLRDDFKQQGCRIAFYEVPLLFEKKMEDQFDDVILVFAPPELQRQRLKIRNHWSSSEIDHRLSALLPDEYKLKRAGHLIKNEGTLEELENQTKNILKTLEARK